MRPEKITVSGRPPRADEEAEPPLFFGGGEEAKVNPPQPSDAELARREEVSPDLLLPYIEFDRIIDPASLPYHQRLLDSIAANGIQSNMLLVYNPETGVAFIAEGNHRLGIARHLGLGSVPVQVRVVEGGHPADGGGSRVPRPLSLQEIRDMGREPTLADLGIGVPVSEPTTATQNTPDNLSPLDKLRQEAEDNSQLREIDLSEGEFQGGSLSELKISRSNLSEARFLETDCSDTNFESSDLSRSVFEGADLYGASFDHTSKLYQATFRNSDLSRATFGGDVSSLELDNCTLDGTSFAHCQGRGAEFGGEGKGAQWYKGQWSDKYDPTRWAGDFPESRFEEADISNCILAGSRFYGSVFRGAVAREADFRDCNLEYCDMSETDCQGASFDRAEMTGVDWQGGNFSEASFDQSNITGEDISSASSFRGASFVATKANKVNCSGLDLRGAVFDDAHLESASFNQASLAGASFRNAYAWGISFDGVDMTGVDLRGACLAEADLRGALNLDKALLEGADLSGAQLPDQ